MSLNPRDSSNDGGNTEAWCGEGNAVIGGALIRNWVPPMPPLCHLAYEQGEGSLHSSLSSAPSLWLVGVNKFSSGEQGEDGAWEEGEEEEQVEVSTDLLSHVTSVIILNSLPFLLLQQFLK